MTETKCEGHQQGEPALAEEIYAPPLTPEMIDAIARGAFAWGLSNLPILPAAKGPACYAAMMASGYTAVVTALDAEGNPDITEMMRSAALAVERTASVRYAHAVGNPEMGSLR